MRAGAFSSFHHGLVMLAVVLVWGAHPVTARAQEADAASAANQVTTDRVTTDRATTDQAAETQPPEYTEEEQRQIELAERFLSILERSPRRGTALDRVYGHHVEFGTLDAFLERLRTDVQADPEDGAAWMLLGLFESQRGEDAAAAEALRNAERLRADDPMAPYYLSQALLRVGENEAAVDAMERALDRDPPRADLLEIFQQLGRVHQRAQRNEAALDVWQRLEALFPDDPRVLEQIAVITAEEGQPELALERYEKLADMVDDDYRRTTFRVAAAELKIKTNRRDAGIADLESILADLNPDGWLYRDVRRRIEDVFLRSSDQDALVQYYEKWLAEHPEDVEAMARLARFLSASARVPEATEWMEKALRLAPSRTELRKAFIDQLVEEQRYAEASEQYARLCEAEPGNPDFLREWGRLVLRDKAVDLERRQAEATRIWNQILENHPEDALICAQVADLFRGAEMNDPALALYQKAVELAPAEPQYREYLGEFYHILKRTDEALATWEAIAAPPRRTAENLARVAEVYNGFGYLDQAVEAITEACQIETKDFALQVQGAEYLNRAGQYDQALERLTVAEPLVTTEEQRATLVDTRIEIYRSSQRLEEETERLAASLAEAASPEIQDWHLLARYREAQRQWADANDAVDQALEIEPRSVPVLTTAARIAEASGNFGRAADLCRQLAEADRRSRDDHLMSVARLEMQLGRTDEALAAAESLIVASPGNTDNYEFLAQMCFRLGRQDQGLETLRKAVRINPNEPHLIMALGSALADQLRTREAIELYWRAFDESPEVEDRISLTMKLVPLYEQINQFEQLVERLERERREEDKRREMTLCLAQAYHTAGDVGTARRELESLLSENTRDTNLLQQLAKLCQASGDLEGAVGYQRQLAAIAPGHETEFPLARMLEEYGEHDEAKEILVRLTRREEDPSRLLMSLDSLLNQGSYEAVIEIVEPLVSQQKDEWELLYREGVAWASMDRWDEAQTRFRRLLAITLPHDAMGTAAEERFQRAQQRARSDNLRGLQSTMPTRQSPLNMLGSSSQVQQATGLVQQEYFGASTGGTQRWSPDVFGVARMAAYGWLLKGEQEARREAMMMADAAVDSSDDDSTADGGDEDASSVAAMVAAQAENPEASREAIYDWLYVAQLLGNNQAIFDVSRRLAIEGGVEEQRFFLRSLQLRGVDASALARSSSQELQNAKTPLSEDDLQLMLTCYHNLNAQADGEQDLAASGGNIVYTSDGQMYVQVGNSYVPVVGAYRGGGMFLSVVLDELELAGRNDEARTMLEAHLARAESASELGGALAMVLAREQPERLPEFFERWHQAALQTIAETPITTAARGQRGSSVPNLVGSVLHTVRRWMGRLAAEEEHQRILEILDRCLDVSVAATRHTVASAAASTRRPAQTLRTNVNYGTSIYYGDSSQYTQYQMIVPTEYLSQPSAHLLLQVHETFKRNGVGEDLSSHLQERVEQASAEDRPYEQLMLAMVLMRDGEEEDAVEAIASAAEAFGDNHMFRFLLADLYATRGDLDLALEVVDGIVARDQQLLQQRETRAIALAERLGDIDRARQAAERLFGLRLTSNEQLALIEPMRRLGMQEMADAILARAERATGNQPSALASLMMLYQGQGKTDEAKQLAHMLLRRTTSPIAALSTATRNPLRYRTADDATRQQALQLLQQTGELKDLIAQTESQLERSPESLRLYETLIEFYETANQRDKIAEVLTTATKLRPNAAGLQLKLAQHYDQSGKPSEACDAYLAVLEHRPSWIAEDLYNIRTTFTRADRVAELADALSKIDVRQISQPYYIVDLASTLMQEDPTSDAALKLVEKAFEAFPSYRENLISNLLNRSRSSQQLWENKRVYELVKKAVIPTPLQIRSNRWSGVGDIYSYSSGGEVNAMFHRMLAAMEGSPVREDFVDSIRAGVEQHPDWLGGQVMLALAELGDGDKEAGKRRLAELMGDEKVMDSMPTATCWIVGQELDRFEDTRPEALRLFERAIRDPSQSIQSQLQYSPVAKLIQIYERTGRTEDARELIRSQVAGSRNDQYDQSYQTYLRAENSAWAAERLLAVGFPVDAAQMYQQLLADPEALEAAAAWNGREKNYYLNQARNGLSKTIQAIEATDAEAANQAVDHLLAVDDSATNEEGRLNLMVSIDSVAAGHQRPALSSTFLELLATLCKEPGIATAVDKRLAQLSDEYPNDLSIAIVLATLRHQREHAEAEQAMEQLARIVADTPLEPIAEGRRPNSRQRREAAAMIPLWLVARECIADERLRETAEPMAQRALGGARRQLKIDGSVAVLYEWGQRLVTAGDRAGAEAKWSELLELATRRPERRGGTAPDADRTSLHRSSDPSVASGRGVRLVALQEAVDEEAGAGDEAAAFVPPLTMSQFQISMIVAEVAAENGMAELSQHAVAEALGGGMPVADPEPMESSRQPRQVILSTSSSSGQAAETPADRVAQRIQQVVEKWEGEAYAAPATYELLRSLVMPAHRGEQVLLYADSRNLASANVKSLGALLVVWAAKADRLAELDAELQQRIESPQARVPGLVLRTLVALSADDGAGAAERLAELAQELDQNASLASAELACHAGLAAVKKEDLEDEAMVILQRWLSLTAQSPNNNSGQDASGGKLASMVNGYLASSGDVDRVRQYYESMLMARQAQYARYSGDYALYIQSRDLARFADEAGRNGMPMMALELVARALDFKTGNYTTPETPTALAFVIDHLRSLPAEERYRVWSEWTLPTESRQSVRLVLNRVVPSTAPENLRNRQLNIGTPDGSGVLCNLTELVAAAEESGRLEELESRAQAAAQQSIPGANYLVALVTIASKDRERAEQFATTFFEDMYKPREAQDPRRQYPMSWGDLVVFLAAFDRGIYFDGSPSRIARFDQHMRGTAFNGIRGAVRGVIARRIARESGLATVPGSRETLGDWFVSGWNTYRNQGVDPWWIANEDSVAHVLGSGEMGLNFAYPVTGDFEFTVDCYNGDWGESDAGYGGVMVLSHQWGDRTRVTIASGNEELSRPQAPKATRPGYGTVRIVSRDGQMIHYLNGYRVYEEQLSGTYPWISVVTDGNRASTFRNPRLTGSPVIPERVPLLAGNRMDGWRIGVAWERQPRHRLMAEPSDGANSTVARQQDEEPTEFDWQTEEGVLTGKSTHPQAGEESHIYYERPLRNGETFEYEFFYVPGEMTAAPTLGQLVLLLRDDGVHSHWMTRSDVEAALTGVEPSDSIVEQDCQRGSGLKLLAGDWNRVSMSMADGTLRLSLNEELVYERPVADLVDHRFGLHHYKGDTVRVRNAYLSGDWPRELGEDVRANMLVRSAVSSAEERQLAELLIPRAHEAVVADQIVRRAREMDEAAAYEYLAAWVLPEEARGRIRMGFEFGPLEDQANMDPMTAAFDRVLSPAIELVRIAGSLGQRDALRQRVAALQPEHPTDVRNQRALLAMIMIDANEVEEARKVIGELRAGLEGGLPHFEEPADLIPELLVALAAGTHDVLWPSGMDLARRMHTLERESGGSIDGDLIRRIFGVAGAIDLYQAGRNRPEHVLNTLANSDSSASVSTPESQWTSVPYLWPQGSARGCRPTTWLYERGMLRHVVGEGWSQLFFQSPLRGKYEITARLSTRGYKEVHLATGMHAAGPRYDLMATRVYTVMHGSRDTGGKIELPVWDEKADFRIVVDGNMVTTFVNGVEIHRESFQQPLDPWLVIQADQPGMNSVVEDVRIHGTPRIPDEINLIYIHNWAAWRFDVYGDWASQNPEETSVPYVRNGDEILGHKRTDRSMAWSESLMMYSRPMLEDGEIEFETWYVPGEFEVHPALGGSAFLIGPEEVALHELTGAQFETGGRDSKNRSPISGSKAPRMKPNEWNHVRLKLVGDAVTLWVNGEEVAQHECTVPSNQRFFGLFRYSDQTQCRVRKVIYRGDWPKTLPTVEDQELARAGGGGLDPEAQEEPVVISLDQPVDQVLDEGDRVLGPRERLIETGEGVRMELRQGGDWKNWPGLEWRRTITGDAEITLDYSGLEMTPVAEGWGTAFCLEVGLGDVHDTVVETTVAMNGEGKAETRASLRRDLPRGDDQTVDMARRTGAAPSGRLRLVRRGGQIHCFAAEGEDGPFTLTYTLTVGDDPIRRISVQAKGSDNQGEMTATAERLTVRAEQ